ncbi:MAG TPA: nuclear transport factor 2 family protein [Puia sp.]|nr:nuclear transport factor 2 family protein [Puia sp.]
MTTQEAVMTTQEIADRLTKLCKESKWDEAVEELFSHDAKSIEPAHSPGPQSVEGIENIRKKGEMFQQMVEKVHGGYVKGPIVAGNHISLGIGMDCTMKGRGRSMMEEIAVYEVKDGKIVKEQFFF